MFHSLIDLGKNEVITILVSPSVDMVKSLAVSSGARILTQLNSLTADTLSDNFLLGRDSEDVLVSRPIFFVNYFATMRFDKTIGEVLI